LLAIDIDLLAEEVDRTRRFGIEVFQARLVEADGFQIGSQPVNRLRRDRFVVRACSCGSRHKLSGAWVVSPRHIELHEHSGVLHASLRLGNPVILDAAAVTALLESH